MGRRSLSALRQALPVLLLALGLAACGDSGLPAAALVTPPVVPPPVTGSKHCRNYNPQRSAFFGDLHVHTRYSLDASTQGTSVGPHDAYKFAQGEAIGVPPYDSKGVALRSTQLARPLDFAAVTDHAEFFGETEICNHPQYSGYNSPECQFYRQQPDQAFIVFNAQLAEPGQPQPDGNKKVQRFSYCGVGGADCLEAAKTPWGDIQRAAEAYNDTSDACRFTTFVAYEWTGSPQSNNLHRNVIFKSATVPVLPVSYLDAAAPEYLWRLLTAQCKSADGCNYLTIPHNSNLSAGLMFKTQDDSGAAFTKAFATTKQLNEPLAEITQHKGQSECLNTTGAGATDELCGFEVLPYNNLTGNRFNGAGTGPPLEQDFLRDALKVGLMQEQALGVNPFKYGFIGSTDTHIGAPGQVLENRFPGHGGAGTSFRTQVPKGLTELIEYNPGGLAVLWAEQNTRDDLYAAMRRREAYGTSGPRMVVRLFGGFNLPADLCGSSDFAAIGYAQGVPMGGDLPAAASPSLKPRFALSALRDPGAQGEPAEPLQRMQIIKGWIDEAGVKRELVVDVAGDANNGATVDESSCATSGPGFASLCAVWEDTGFKPGQSSYYYGRVVQNPSCRWATFQCNAGHVDCSNASSVPTEYKDCCNAKYPKTIQERAWTSPIWYRRPAG